MKWYHNLYIKKKKKKDKDKLIREINGKTGPVNVYLLTLPVNPQNQLEIIPALFVKIRYQEQACPMIVGIARGRREAEEVLLEIVDDVLEKTGKPDLRSYFLERS